MKNAVCVQDENAYSAVRTCIVLTERGRAVVCRGGELGTLANSLFLAPSTFQGLSSGLSNEMGDQRKR